MRRLALRAGLLFVLTVGLFAGPGFAYFEFPYTPQASAQQATVEPLQSPTTSDTPAPSATAVPTPTDTPVPLSPSAIATDVSTTTDTATATDTPAASATGTETATATATVAPTSTPIPVTDLPPLTDNPDIPGTVVQATIDSTGGRIASPDGRVTVDVPAGLFPAPLQLSVTRKAHKETVSPNPDAPLASLWDFAARTTDGAATPVHLFSGNSRSPCISRRAISLDATRPRWRSGHSTTRCNSG